MKPFAWTISFKCICFTNQNQNIQNTIMVLHTVMVQKLMAQEFQKYSQNILTASWWLPAV